MILPRRFKVVFWAADKFRSSFWSWPRDSRRGISTVRESRRGAGLKVEVVVLVGGFSFSGASYSCLRINQIIWGDNSNLEKKK